MRLKLSSSREDYVETIFQITCEKKGVRASDIADRMQVSRPSVTGALRLLVRDGLVNHQPYDVISLTDDGETIAKDVIRRHSVLKDFFVTCLGVADEQAEHAACGMEHALPGEVLGRLVVFVEEQKKK